MKPKKQLIYILLILSFCITCGAGCIDKKVYDATGTLPEIPSIDISEPNRFLNDLMLSPLWKVDKKRDGSFIAEPRTIGKRWSFDGENSFLFEFMADPNNKLPKDYQIRNRNSYFPGNDIISSFQVCVVFQKLDLTRITLGESGQKVTVGVYEPYDNGIGPNSYSYLAIKLSSQHDIYVLLNEQGADPERKTTFAKILPTIKELAEIANSPEVYRCEERYKTFFELFFSLPLKDGEIKRFPGLQDRDTLYGYLRTKPDINYAGINIKISHPVYCPDEGTRRYDRLRKAEYPGKPYQDGDILFFLIEDNAVYLSGEYDQRFGTFTGKESFEGTLEVLNENNEVLLKTTKKFKGWQR